MDSTAEYNKPSQLQLLGLDPATMADPKNSPLPVNDDKVAQDPLWSMIAKPKSETPQPKPESPTNSPVGLYSTPPPRPAPNNRPEASSTTGVEGHQQQQPVPAQENPLADTPTYNPSTPGLLPVTPPGQTYQGYNPSDNSRVQIEVPQQPAPPASTPYPASKVRLPDEGDGPRWAVLNSAGEYLFTIDDTGKKISTGGGNTTPGLSSTGPAASAGLAVGTGTVLEAESAAAAATRATTSAAARAALLAATEEAAILGAPAGPLGSALTAGITLIVAGGLIYWDYNHNNPFNGDSDTETEERIDPDSIPEIVRPKPTPTPEKTNVPPADNGGIYVDPGTQPGLERPVDTTPTTPNSPPLTRPTRPSPADDPDTSHQQILFPSADPTQTKGVPVEGTYWEGNRLKYAPGNPAGKPPNTYAKNPNRPTELNLEAGLYKLLESGIDDVDDEHRPKIMAAMAVLQGTLLYRDIYLGAIGVVGGSSADIGKLTSPNKKTKEEELRRLGDLGVPQNLLNNAIAAWWGAKAPVDRAKELLGEAGAIAMLEMDGWTVNPRPKGNNTHDIVAAKNGEVMVIEAKGGDPRPPRPGEATVSAGPGLDTDILAQQMTDPYLWHKLKQDADNDPDFMQWLVDQGVWTAIKAEDPSKVGYRLIKVDTNGNIIIYGAEQTPTREGIPAETVIGQTTGNGPGPTLRGIAQPLPQTTLAVSTGTFLDGLLPSPGSWLRDLVQTGLHDVSALARLAVPVPVVPALQPGLWSARKSANESLTVNVVQETPPGHYMPDAEGLHCMTYL
ncbi:hypothetical protein OG203_35505 [Nocardia sp. NBC_01499]|uniref:hypothetical protein n=1 Tax=Nocardia sp. NBC_01499 TaxID=2903597 RepID=UPI0038642D13